MVCAPGLIALSGGTVLGGNALRYVYDKRNQNPYGLDSVQGNRNTNDIDLVIAINVLHQEEKTNYPGDQQTNMQNSCAPATGHDG